MLLALELVVLLVAGCTDVVACKPCGPPVVIDVSSFRSEVDSVRVCLNDGCGDSKALNTQQPGVWVMSQEVYDHASIRLETFVGAKMRASYQLDDLSLRRPTGKGCDCGEQVDLIPQADGTLVKRRDLPSSPSPSVR
ncbi:hypothetical protein [Kribbella monticola]|uniref:hypothetical protein n=1 Tax=Kribbella monticola TaxID=2185285 RepID=UPI000DD3F2C7|nr:hypothetical protein [Kribbella monticola]